MAASALHETASMRVTGCSPQWLSSSLNRQLHALVARHPSKTTRARQQRPHLDLCSRFPEERFESFGLASSRSRSRSRGLSSRALRRSLSLCRSLCLSWPFSLPFSSFFSSCFSRYSYLRQVRVLVNPHVQHSSATYSKKKKQRTHRSRRSPSRLSDPTRLLPLLLSCHWKSSLLHRP